jgi:hypothetical protein
MAKSNNREYSSPIQPMAISDFLKLEKRNSDNNIQNSLLNFDDEDHICLESIESEFCEHVNKLSVISEIKQIVNQPSSIDFRTSIERCANPFSKNFPELENEKNKENEVESSCVNLTITEKTLENSEINEICERNISKNLNFLNQPCQYENKSNIKESDSKITDMRVNTCEFSIAENSITRRTSTLNGINENISDARNNNCAERNRKEKDKKTTNNRNLKNRLYAIKEADKETANSSSMILSYQHKTNKANLIETEKDYEELNRSRSRFNFNYDENDMSSIELNSSINSSFLYPNFTFTNINVTTTTIITERSGLKEFKGSSFIASDYNKAKLYESLIRRKRLRAKASSLIRQPSKSKTNSKITKKTFKKSLSRKVSTKEPCRPESKSKLNNTILACIFSPSFYEYKIDAFPTNKRIRCGVTSHFNTETNQDFNLCLQLAH